MHVGGDIFLYFLKISRKKAFPEGDAFFLE